MSGPPPDLTVFAGPTLHDSRDRAPQDLVVRWRPPVARDDVARLVADEPPGRLVIVDGVFHQTLAVGHAELRDALQRGWSVWGLSSIGAIRAFEMRYLGMRGFGEVYRRFLTGEDFRDDEVALLHEPGPSWRPVSEPLVHMRAALEDLVARALVEAAAADAIVSDLANRWFGERMLPGFRSMVLAAVSSEGREQAECLLNDFQRYRVKSRDLDDFWQARAWEA